MGRGGHNGPADKCDAPPLPGAPSSSYKMLSIEEATRKVLDVCPLKAPEMIPLSEAGGCILAETATAREPLPPYPASIKDGYAVVASDGVGTYKVVGDARAGDVSGINVVPGTVAYITTGGPVPPGADAVVMVERTNEAAPDADGNRQVKILEAVRKGADIRPVGFDIKAGQAVLEPGEVLHPAEVGLLATVGATRVWSRPRPRVAVLSTGDEILDPSTERLGPGQIRDSNRSMLLAAAASLGCETFDLGIAKDTSEDLEGKFDEAIACRADILLTSGGVSMGDRDLVKPLLESRGTVHFGRVKMKPGKPLTFASIDVPLVSGPPSRRMLVFGLPGNPVSSMVTFHLCVQPAVRRLAGWTDPHLRRVHARLAQPLKLDPERPEYHRATLTWSPALGGGAGGELLATSTGGQISSRLLSMRSANALLELPCEKGTLPAGAVVTALLIQDLGGMPVRAPVAITPPPAAAAPPPSPAAKLAMAVKASALAIAPPGGRGGEVGLAEGLRALSAVLGVGAAAVAVAGVGGAALRSLAGSMVAGPSGGGGDLFSSTPAPSSGRVASNLAGTLKGVASWGAAWGGVLLFAAARPRSQPAPATPREPSDPLSFRAAVLTVSDTVSSGEGPDRSGPAAAAAIAAARAELGAEVVVAQAVPDNVAAIQRVLRAWADGGKVDLVITTGGTGMAPRDVTPEATRPILHREAGGLVATMLSESSKIVPTAMLSRPAAGTRGSTLIINMPGNPKAVPECLGFLMPALPHALRQLRGAKFDHPRHLAHDGGEPKRECSCH